MQCIDLPDSELDEMPDFIIYQQQNPHCMGIRTLYKFSIRFSSLVRLYMRGRKNACIYFTLYILFHLGFDYIFEYYKSNIEQMKSQLIALKDPLAEKGMNQFKIQLITILCTCLNLHFDYTTNYREKNVIKLQLLIKIFNYISNDQMLLLFLWKSDLTIPN